MCESGHFTHFLPVWTEKLCENPGICTYFWLLRRPAARLMSKKAHPRSRNHRFPHLVSKTAPARSRNHRFTRLMSKTAPARSRNHRLTHLVSKTAPARSRNHRLTHLVSKNALARSRAPAISSRHPAHKEALWGIVDWGEPRAREGDPVQTDSCDCGLQFRRDCISL